MKLLRLLESLHGHLAILAIAGLLHPAILLRKGKPMTGRTSLSVILTCLAVVLAFGSGLYIYPSYVAEVKVSLFLTDPRAGLLFETKEHLAYAVVAMTVGATVCAIVAPRERPDLRRAAALIFAAAALLCAAVVVLGTYVTAVHGFGSTR